jgi:capsular polysaccharide biosynthesis protein
MDIANQMVKVMQEVSSTYEGFDNIEILDEAQLPLQPSGPNRILYVVIGVILGGITGVGIIFIAEMMDKTIKTSKDIEQKLNLRVLATIPEYVMPEDQKDDE